MNYRSPWFPILLGVALFIISMLNFFVAGGSLAFWIFLLAACPLLIEGEAWRDASIITSIAYDIDKNTIFEEAYNPNTAMPRYVVLYVWLFAILVAREINVLPIHSFWWTIFILIAPAFLYVAHAVISYRTNIGAFIRDRGIKRSSKPIR